jgi:tight adherence protein C
MDALCIKCNMPAVRRMTSVLVQNMNRGGTDVLLVLKEIGKELWNDRRATAKRMAEQAGTKLLFPMMLMLLAVIVIVAAPAIMSLGSTGI